ncbi:hypothetical protein EV426DRAFT_577637 [Tirmania nivea]|nr:hypothetical protein EV426DRAFT_577637 [Tirmania nivea]
MCLEIQYFKVKSMSHIIMKSPKPWLFFPQVSSNMNRHIRKIQEFILVAFLTSSLDQMETSTPSLETMSAPDPLLLSSDFSSTLLYPLFACPSALLAPKATLRVTILPAPVAHPRKLIEIIIGVKARRLPLDASAPGGVYFRGCTSTHHNTNACLYVIARVPCSTQYILSNGVNEMFYWTMNATYFNARHSGPFHAPLKIIFDSPTHIVRVVIDMAV